MSEFRQDIITKEWVLIAPSRAGRPQEFNKDLPLPEPSVELNPSCIFCPGNEKQTPNQIVQYPRTGDWRVRMVPNKFGLLELGKGEPSKNFYVSLPGIGSHDVVITRYHNQPMALQSVELINEVLEVYSNRVTEMESQESVKYVHIIQNHGKLAGASLQHPHSQIFSMPFVGPHVQEEIRGSAYHHDIFDACIYCSIISHEISLKKRVVIETENFLAICPFESKMPYQIRILSKRHEARFNHMTAAERQELAAVLKSVLAKIYVKLGNPAYNYYIHTLPFSRSQNLSYNEKAYHWHLVIMPRINIWAGLELGTEIYVNTVPPEQAAEFLRGHE